MKRAPQIYQGTNKHGQECWYLTHHDGPLSVKLEIRFYYGDDEGPSHYNILAAHDCEQRNAHSHGYMEVLTQQEVADRAETCEQYEGTKIAKGWLRTVNDHYMVIGKYNKILRIANQLKGRWEALQTIVTPHVTF